jgi:hypothetical protein
MNVRNIMTALLAIAFLNSSTAAAAVDVLFSLNNNANYDIYFEMDNAGGKNGGGNYAYHTLAARGTYVFEHSFNVNRETVLTIYTKKPEKKKIVSVTLSGTGKTMHITYNNNLLFSQRGPGNGKTHKGYSLANNVTDDEIKRRITNY